MRPGLVAVAAALAALGCNAGDQFLRLGRSGDPPPPRARLWTLWDIQAALVEGTRVAPSPSFPTGFDPNWFLNDRGDGTQELRVVPAYSEGAPAGFVSAEVWVNYDEVWIQPWYVQLKRWNGAAGAMENRLTGAPPIWDVSPDSLFYNPLWLYIYVVVGDVDPNKYRSSEELFEDKLEMHWSGGWTFSARPANVVGEAMPAAGSGREPLLHPIMGTRIGNLRQFDTSWADKKQYAYFDQGSNNFKFDTRLVAEEVPQFVLARRDEAGNPADIGVPRVMGVAPLHSKRPPDLSGGRPRFGAYSRLYFALIGANAQPFDPDPEKYPVAVKALADQNIDPAPYIGRVANNAMGATGCFNSPMFPMTCQWLDSQAQVENLGVQNIVRTEISMSSALVFWNGKGIGL